MQEAPAKTPLDSADLLQTALAHIRARPALFIGIASASALPGLAFSTWGTPYVHTLTHTCRPFRSVYDLMMRSYLSNGISAVVLLVIAVLTSAFRTTVATLAVMDPRLGAMDVLDEARARFFAVVRTWSASSSSSHAWCCSNASRPSPRSHIAMGATCPLSTSCAPRSGANETLAPAASTRCAPAMSLRRPSYA